MNIKNMDENFYYTAPSDKAFNEVKENAIKIWSTVGDEPSYSREKIGRIEDLKNIQDNIMYMVAMFDAHNQQRLASMLSDETRTAIRERLLAGGQPAFLIVF